MRYPHCYTIFLFMFSRETPQSDQEQSCSLFTLGLHRQNAARELFPHEEIRHHNRTPDPSEVHDPWKTLNVSMNTTWRPLVRSMEVEEHSVVETS
mmetsp:Transcript_48877/g.106100  ORF Transcript_48877/g.106100 Transcript_48877/m.106100 type:complete len:95 (-) Transcript_48877:23-307(-)